MKVPNLRTARLRRALSQSELATLSGCSRNTISNGEMGAELSVATVRRVTQALRLQPVVTDEVTELAGVAS